MGALMNWLNSRPPESPATPRKLQSIDELRRQSIEALADCTRPHDERIRSQLAMAATAQQLWQVRSDIYQAVARRHCEAEAVRRVNGLLQAFEGWLPPSALTRL